MQGTPYITGRVLTNPELSLIMGPSLRIWVAVTRELSI